jgi:Thiamine pyrophosphate enzyme, C-terminal TPP binding domain
VFVVSNNAAWNIECLDQQLNCGGRVVGATLRHSDYAAMARALGLYGERVEKPEDLRPALQRALNAPALVDVVTSQEVMSSDAQKGLGFVPIICAVPFGLNARQKNAWFYDGYGLKLMNEFGMKSNAYSLPGGNSGVQPVS